MLEAENVNNNEKCEEFVYRTIVYLPVMITFGFITMLSIFYVAVSLLFC